MGVGARVVARIQPHHVGEQCMGMHSAHPYILYLPTTSTYCIWALVSITIQPVSLQGSMYTELGSNCRSMHICGVKDIDRRSQTEQTLWNALSLDPTCNVFMLALLFGTGRYGVVCLFGDGYIRFVVWQSH